MVSKKGNVKYKPVCIWSTSFYINLYEQICIFLNIKNTKETVTKLNNYIEVDRMIREETARNNRTDEQLDKDVVSQTSTTPSYVNLYTLKNLENKKLYFLEEIRCIILLEIKICKDKHTSHQLKQLHMYLHMLQLHFTRNMSLFDKLNEFLNTNFKISSGDPILNLVRGNFGEFTDIKPEMHAAVEKFESGRAEDNFDLSKWASSYKVTGVYYDIFANRYLEFPNVIEYCCYKLKYDSKFNINEQINECDLIQILITGTYPKQSKEHMVDSLQLIYCILNPHIVDHNTKVIQSQTTNVFYEVSQISFLLALRFLTFSKQKNVIFNTTTADADFTKILNPNEVVKFAAENEICCKTLINQYTKHLQEKKEYRTLINFLIEHSVKTFDYDKETLTYFVDNFSKFSDRIELPFLKCNRNMFIHSVANIEDANEMTFEFLIKHRYFHHFIERILPELCKTNNKKLVLLALNRVIEAESKGYVHCTNPKKILLDTLND